MRKTIRINCFGPFTCFASIISFSILEIFGFMYAFYALPISEVCVFIFALFLLKGRLPQELIKINFW